MPPRAPRDRREYMAKYQEGAALRCSSTPGRVCKTCGVPLDSTNNNLRCGRYCIPCHQARKLVQLRAFHAANPGYQGKTRSDRRLEGTVTAKEWFDRLVEFGHACAYCLKTGLELTMDHVIPVSRGGLHEIGNVIPACRLCNGHKKARSIFVMLGPYTEALIWWWKPTGSGPITEAPAKAPEPKMVKRYVFPNWDLTPSELAAWQGSGDPRPLSQVFRER